MRNSYLFLLITMFAAASMSAQVKIGDNPQNINPSSVLELESTDKVLVITRVSTAQMNAIVPSQGALCYNIDLQSVHYYDGTQWVDLGGGGTGSTLTANPIINDISTIVITPIVGGANLEVAPNSIRSEQIVDGGINGVDIQDGSIGPGKIQDFSITQEKLSENSVGAFALDNDSFGVSAFNNDAGYITAGDVNIVSGDVGNVLETRTDGVFYNNQPLITAINQNTDGIALDDDQSSANEIQNPELTGTLLGLSGTAGTVDLGPLLSAGGSDDQNLTLTGNMIEIEDGNTIDLTPILGAGGTDDQNLTLTGNMIEIEDGNTIDLTPILGAGGTDDQNLTLTGNMIEIEDGNTIDLTPILGAGGSDDQNLTLTGNMIEIEDGNTIDLTPILGAGGTDDQTAAEVTYDNTTSALTAITTQAAIDEIAAAGGSDDQTAAEVTYDNTTSALTAITTQAAIDEIAAAGGSDDQTAAEVTYDNTTSALTAITTQAAIDEIAAAGGSDDQTAAEVTYDNTTSALTATTTQAAIDEIAAAGEVNTASNQGTGGVGIVLTKNVADLPFKSINSGTSGIISVTDDTVENEIEIDIVPATPLATPANQMLITNGTNDEVEWAPLASHSGTPNEIFFAAPITGIPTGHPGFIWNPIAIAGGFPALGIGLDGRTQSTKAKVHIDEQYNGLGDISFGLQLQNRGSVGNSVGMIFGVHPSNIDGKGALLYERTGAEGIGDFHFLQVDATTSGNPSLANKAFTIYNNSDVKLYAGLEASNGLGGDGQVLSSATIAGQKVVTWVNAGGLPTGTTTGQVIKWNNATPGWELGTDNTGTPTLDDGNIFVGNASDQATSVTMSGDALIDNAGELTIQANAIDNGMLNKTNIPLSGFGAADANVAMGGFKITDLAIPTIDQDAATKKYVDDNGGGHAGTAAGSVFFSGVGPGFAPTDNNAQLFWDNTNNRLGIGINTPTAQLQVANQIRAGSFAGPNLGGSATNPTYRFNSTTKNDGMFQPLDDEIAFSTGGVEAIRIDDEQNVGIGTITPTSTLHTGGSFASNIRTDTNVATVDIGIKDYTVIISAAGIVNLPAAAPGNLGRIYILKNTKGVDIAISSFSDSLGAVSTLLVPGITQLHSDGGTWHQIN